MCSTVRRSATEAEIDDVRQLHVSFSSRAKVEKRRDADGETTLVKERSEQNGHFR